MPEEPVVIEITTTGADKAAEDLEKVAGATGDVGTEAEDAKEPMGELGRETEKTGKRSDKTGRLLGRLALKLTLGFYAARQFISKINQAKEALVKFVKDGIDKAIKAHTEYGKVIEASTTTKLDSLQKLIGEKVLPAYTALKKAQGDLLDAFRETGVIDAFARALNSVFTASAAMVSGLAQDLRDLQGLANSITGGKGGVLTSYSGFSKMMEQGEADVWGATYGRLPTMLQVPAALISGVGISPMLRHMAEKGKKENVAEAEREAMTMEYQRRQAKEGKAAADKWLMEQQRRNANMGPRPASESGGGGGGGAAPYYGPMGKNPDLTEMEIYKAQREIEYQQELKDIERMNARTRVVAQAGATQAVGEQGKADFSFAEQWGDVAGRRLVETAIDGNWKEVGEQMAVGYAGKIVGKGITSIIKQIPFLGAIAEWLPEFQHEGTVNKPTIAMIGEREPESVIKKSHIPALQAGYGLRMGDGSVIPPAGGGNEVHVHINPMANVDVTTARNARAGEVKLSKREA